jgi:AraC family transcriptional regulator, transcriptional activator of pobA
MPHFWTIYRFYYIFIDQMTYFYKKQNVKTLIGPFNWRSGLKSKQIDSIDDDFALLENPVVTTGFESPFKLDVTIAIICIGGTMKGAVNLKHYSIEAPCIFIVLHDQILQYEYFSEDFSGLFIIMSRKFLTNLSVDIQERVPLYLSVHDNPWTQLNKEELELMTDYYKMLQRSIRDKENPHRLEIVKHLTQAFFYGSGYRYQNLQKTEKKSKHDILVERFLNLVQTNYKVHHTLYFYADKLCLTPKYLSKVIKENSGMTANDWIDNYLTLEARALLKSTNMTIQQISDDLNFQSQSFFGKYFKRHVGTSPKEYRKN